MGPPTSALTSVDRSVWLELLRCMLLTRRTEERLIRLYHQGQIYGGVYTGIGQEAIGASTTRAGGPNDLFGPCIRDMTVHIGRGESVLNIFRQWLARETGPMRGRDGNVHHGNLQHGVYSMISHLGAMLSVIVGGVMARRRLGKPDAVGVAYIGEGGTSTGDFHEAVNFAAVFDAPVLFVIENNHYAYSTPSRLQYRCERLADKAAGYGIEGHYADGNDAVELYLLASRLLGEMRLAPRPMLLECQTMRMRGHGEHDDFSYVPRELLEEYAARDPIELARRRLASEGVVSDEFFKELDAACQAEVERSYQQALSEPRPHPSTLTDGVYSDA